MSKFKKKNQDFFASTLHDREMPGSYSAMVDH